MRVAGRCLRSVVSVCDPGTRRAPFRQPVWGALDGVRKRAVELQGRDVPRSRCARRVVGPRRRLRRGDRDVQHRAQLGLARRVPRPRTPLPAPGRRSPGRHAMVAREVPARTRSITTSARSPTPKAYARLLGEIAAHSRGVIDDWEIRNEPDGDWAYLGTAKDYARELRAASAAIHQANPRARVLMGGVMTLDSRPWLEAVLEAGGAAAIDVANVHVRGPIASLGRIMRRWREFFDRAGRGRAALGDRARVPVRPALPERSRVPRRRARAGRLPGPLDPGAAQRRGRAGVHHRARQPRRLVRLGGVPGRHGGRSAGRRPRSAAQAGRRRLPGDDPGYSRSS